MSETTTPISTENMYVVQLSHNTDENAPAKYLIKDRALTEEVENLKRLLQGYQGLAGSNGELSETWLTTDTSPVPGLYIVESIAGDLIFDGDLILENNEVEQTSIKVLLEAWETYPRADDNTESYINTITDYTYTTDINLPAILIVGENATYTLIDSNDIIWKRVQVENRNVWINLWNNKANIQDFRKLCEIVAQQDTKITTLEDEIAALKRDVADLISLKELADILTGTVDIEGSFNNVLVIGNDINYYVNDTRCRVEELLKKYLHINGIVVWMQNMNTIDALKYLVPVPNTNDYPKMIRNKDDNIYFSDYPIDIDQIDITEFDVVVILLNRNDMYSNTVYNNKPMDERIGGAESANGLTISTDSGSIEYFKNEDIGIEEEPTKNSSVVKYVPATVNKNTIYSALTGIIQAIKNANPEMTFRMATPITWEKNSTSLMTSTQNKSFTNYTSMMQNTLCKNNGIPFIPTVQISGESKVNQLRDRADGLSDAANQKIIMEYISQICADVNMSSGQNVTYNINTQALQGSVTVYGDRSKQEQRSFTFTPGAVGVLNVTFTSSVNEKTTSANASCSKTLSLIGKKDGADITIPGSWGTKGWNNKTFTIEGCTETTTITFTVICTASWTESDATQGTTILVKSPKDTVTFNWKFDISIPNNNNETT